MDAWREAVNRNIRLATPPLGSMTELELQAYKVPWPRSEGELLDIVNVLSNRKQDYGTCVYSMSIAAVAAFNYISHVVGATGFQAECADIDVIRRTRGIKGPFAIINAENMVYPQYDIPEKVREYLKKWRPWAVEEAKKNLAEEDPRYPAHPDVVAHWKKLKEATDHDTNNR